MAANLPDEKRCTATAKTTGERCRRPRYKGTTVCRYHGGAAAVKNLKHGRYSKSRHSLPIFAKEVARHLEHPEELKKLDGEIALARVIVEKRLESVRKRAAAEAKDDAALTAWINERMHELSRLLQIAQALQRGEKVSKADRDWFLVQRSAEAITEREETLLRDGIKAIGDLVAKKSKIEDGVKHTLSWPEVGRLAEQLKDAVKSAVAEVLTEEQAKAVHGALQRRIADLRVSPSARRA